MNLENYFKDKLVNSENSTKTSMGAGVAFESAQKFSKTLASWNPPLRSADIDIIPDKDLLDARSLDSYRNDGYVNGARKTVINNTVGTSYKLIATPAYKALGKDKEWARVFREEVESKFQLWAESPDNWVDKYRTNNFTQLLRQAVSSYFLTGEVLAIADWDNSSDRFMKTCISIIDPCRLKDPYNKIAYTKNNRGGIEFNDKGIPIYYNIRNYHPGDLYDMYGANINYTRIARKTSWGRFKVIHLFTADRPEQTRGVSAMVSVLKELKTMKKFRDIVLQNAVVQATYAAVLQTNLPTDMAHQALGAGLKDGSTWEQEMQTFLTQLAEYHSATGGVKIDGVQVPVLMPGEELKILAPTQGGPLGTEFEASLLMNIAAALGVSYESLSKDFKKSSYSSARAGMLEMYKNMQTIKTDIVNSLAKHVYALWLEEAITRGLIQSVTTDMPSFYEGLNKEAYISCDWIGPARGQIEELKEEQASALRINNGLTSRRREAAKQGIDFDQLLEELAEEKEELEKRGLTFGENSNMMNSVQGKAEESDARQPDSTEEDDSNDQ